MKSYLSDNHISVLAGVNKSIVKVSIIDENDRLVSFSCYINDLKTLDNLINNLQTVRQELDMYHYQSVKPWKPL